MTQASQFVFILGPHRSGSSLAAGALHALGVNLGKRYIEPNEDNPKGFFEDEDIVKLNDRLLRSQNLSWDSFGFTWEQDFSAARLRPYHKAAVSMVSERFADLKLAGIKDPRLCIVLPFWKSVIAEALDVQVSYVLSIREPEQCVRSQKTRHLKDSDFHRLGRRSIHTLLLWWTYMTKALAHIDPNRLLIVDYATLVNTPELELRRFGRFLGVEPSPVETDTFCRDHVEPLLNRSEQARQLGDAQSALPWRYADTLYDRLAALSKKDAIAPQDIECALDQLDTRDLEPFYIQEMQFMNGYSYKKIISLRHRLIQTIHEVKNEQDKFRALLQNYNSLHADHESLFKEHQAFLNSRGWRLLTAIRRLIPWPFR